MQTFMEEFLSYPVQILSVVLILILILQVVTLQKMKNLERKYKGEIGVLQKGMDELLAQQSEISKVIHEDGNLTEDTAQSIENVKKEAPETLINAVLSEVFS